MMMGEKQSWLRRAIAATDECADGAWESLYQNIWDTVCDDVDGGTASQVAPMIVMGLFKEAVKRGHLHLEIGLELMSRGVSKWEDNPPWHDVPISTYEKDASLDFDIWDGQCIPGHLSHKDEWAALRKEKIEGEYAPWPVNYWLLPSDLPPEPMVTVSSFYMRTAQQVADDARDRWEEKKQRDAERGDA